jgi:hypothetical protein
MSILIGVIIRRKVEEESMKNRKGIILSALFTIVVFVSSCSSVVKRSEPQVDQINGLFGLNVVLEEDYSPQFANNIALPVMATVGGNEVEIAFVSIAGATPEDPNAKLSIQVDLENYLPFAKDLTGIEKTDQLPNGLGHFSRLKKAGDPNFVTVPNLWAIALNTPRASVESIDANKLNGIVYVPAVDDTGALPEKVYFGGAIRLDIFNSSPQYELAAMIPVPITNDGEVFAMMAVFGAGDQSAGEFPGMIVMFELGALKRAAGSSNIVTASVNIAKERDAIVKADSVKRDHGEMVSYFGEMLDELKEIDFL